MAESPIDRCTGHGCRRPLRCSGESRRMRTCLRRWQDRAGCWCPGLL